MNKRVVTILTIVAIIAFSGVLLLSPPMQITESNSRCALWLQYVHALLCF